MRNSVNPFSHSGKQNKKWVRSCRSPFYRFIITSVICFGRWTARLRFDSHTVKLNAYDRIDLKRRFLFIERFPFSVFVRKPDSFKLIAFYAAVIHGKFGKLHSRRKVRLGLQISLNLCRKYKTTKKRQRFRDPVSFWYFNYIFLPPFR